MRERVGIVTVASSHTALYQVVESGAVLWIIFIIYKVKSYTPANGDR